MFSIFTVRDKRQKKRERVGRSLGFFQWVIHIEEEKCQNLLTLYFGYRGKGVRRMGPLASWATPPRFLDEAPRMPPPPPRNRIREPTGGAKNTGRARPSAGGCSQPPTCVRARQSEGGRVG